MSLPPDEEAELRAVALQNAASILSARRRAEEEVAESLALVRATLEATADAILVTSRDRTVTGFNKKFLEMWRIPSDVMDSKDHMKVVEVISRSFHDSAAYLTGIDAIYAALPSQTYDLLTLADGRVIERVSQVQIVDERNIGRVWSFRDITELKRAEQTLREQSALLKDADRRKDEFLALLAHELRNPLAPIVNSVHVLKASIPDSPDLRWATDVIDRQVRLMKRLVDDLLDVSRITTGKINLRRNRIDLAEIARSAVEDSRPLINEWGHEIDVTLPPGPVFLVADGPRLSQVLLNLLHNAAKYTNPGGRISLVVAPDGDRAVIRVKDTGVGIPAEMLVRIFEIFTQVDSSVERSRGGLGAGLTLVRSIVELHGGIVEAHSPGPGQGSEFIVRLPLT